MAELQGGLGAVEMTIEIKRAATGETETVQLTGVVTLEEPDEEESE